MANIPDSFDAWEEKYKPIPNTINPNDSNTFETFGTDLEFLKTQEVHHIWTEIQGDDGNLYIVNGIHWVNRLVYYVTEIPWEEGDEIEILSCEFEDEEDDEDNI